MSLPVGTPEEFGKKLTVSISLIIFVVICAILVTISVMNSNSTDKTLTKQLETLTKKVDQQNEDLKELVQMEVGGLRSDMVKEDAHLKEMIDKEMKAREEGDDDVNKRINRKIDNHKKEKNPH